MPGVKAVVLDIEGTVISISFVKDVLFPYARRNLADYLERHWGEPALAAVVASLHTQAKQDALWDGLGPPPVGDPKETSPALLRSQLVANVLWQMDRDRKAAPLKTLQGHIWQEGYDSGQLQAPLYADVVPALRAWKQSGVALYIYSSGSVQAQKLLFQHTTEGDLTELLSGYFDITTSGAKTEPQSYRAISKAISTSPGDILFLTDVIAEAQAATEADFLARLVVRPGNAPLTDDQKAAFESVTSFDALEL